MDDLLRMDHCRPEVPTRLPTAMEQILTPLNWREWDRCLMAHPDQRFRTYIVEGIRYGFRIGFNYSSSCVSSPRNMASAMKNPEVIREYLANECSEGRVLGPYGPRVFTANQYEPLWGYTQGLIRWLEADLGFVIP